MHVAIEAQISLAVLSHSDDSIRLYTGLYSRLYIAVKLMDHNTRYKRTG